MASDLACNVLTAERNRLCSAFAALIPGTSRSHACMRLLRTSPLSGQRSAEPRFSAPALQSERYLTCRTHVAAGQRSVIGAWRSAPGTASLRGGFTPRESPSVPGTSRPSAWVARERP